MADANIPGAFERTVFSQAPLCINPQSQTANAYVGQTIISSAASNLQAIPAGAVTSHSVVVLTIEKLAVTSEAVPSWAITSRNPGTGFHIQTTASWALINSYAMNWLVFNQT